RRYKFPYGDFKNVHRCSLLAVKARARQYGYAQVENAATELERTINEKSRISDPFAFNAARPLKRRRSILVVHRCTRLQGLPRQKYRLRLTTYRTYRNLRAQALVATVGRARRRQTLQKPKANQVRERSGYRENAARHQQFQRGA